MNALAKVQNKFLKIDLDKWSRVVPSDQVSLLSILVTINTSKNKYLHHLHFRLLIQLRETTISQRLNTNLLIILNPREAEMIRKAKEKAKVVTSQSDRNENSINHHCSCCVDEVIRTL